jgi:hypothetical protein
MRAAKSYVPYKELGKIDHVAQGPLCQHAGYTPEPSSLNKIVPSEVSMLILIKSY